MPSGRLLLPLRIAMAPSSRLLPHQHRLHVWHHRHRHRPLQRPRALQLQWLRLWQHLHLPLCRLGPLHRRHP
jgi:hypothetical protein